MSDQPEATTPEVTILPAPATPQPGVDHSVEVVEQTLSTVETRVPGAAIVTAEDQANLEQAAAEAAEHTVLPIYEAPLVVPTDTPEANLAARSNIISDGPGTVGHLGS